MEYLHDSLDDQQLLYSRLQHPHFFSVINTSVTQSISNQRWKTYMTDWITSNFFTVASIPFSFFNVVDTSVTDSDKPRFRKTHNTQSEGSMKTDMVNLLKSIIIGMKYDDKTEVLQNQLLRLTLFSSLVL